MSDPTSGQGESRAALGDLLRYLREHRAVLAVVVVVSIVAAALTLAQPLVVNQVISAVGDGQAVGTLVLVLVALVVVSGMLGAVQQYLLERTAEGVVLSARRKLINGLFRLPIREYDVRRSGDLVSRVGSDTTLIRAALTGGLVDALAGSIIFVGAVIAMAVIDVVLLGITVAVISASVVSVVIASARIQHLTRQSQEAVGRVGAGVERAISAIRTIRAAGATDREIQALVGEAEAAYDFGVRIARIGAVLWPISGLAIQAAFLAVLGVGGYRVAEGALSVADLVTFILFLFMMLMPLGQAFSAVITVRSALGALARVQEILALPAESDTAIDLYDTGVRAEAMLAFDGVTIGYAQAQPVLRDVSFEVASGQTTAIVGLSGSGKSTLLSLIERFYEPDAGTISVGGRDVRALPRSALRRQVAYVEQDSPVLAGSIRANLVLAAPEADEATCRHALASVNLLQRIDEHPAGLDATVGDSGAGLSGGERQRLAIARALIGDAPMLLLDEPTANLDGRNEQAMRHAIRTAAVGRTVLIVAHRLATVADADRIVLLDAGAVSAVGTHEELLQSSALYRELAEHQLLV
ncbi:MAG: ABC transporter ATP-binding protein [Candidatus Nanopelagicales bacterium]